MNESIAEYERRYYAFLNRIANSLEALLRDHLRDVPDIDRIVARAKSPDRFAEKARRAENGQGRRSGL